MDWWWDLGGVGKALLVLIVVTVVGCVEQWWRGRFGKHPPNDHATAESPASASRCSW